MSEVTAGKVAAELRKFADALDKEPDAIIERPNISLYSWYSETAKARIQAAARVLPRPVVKDYTDDEVRLTYSTDAIFVRATAPRNSVCNILVPAKPAVYDCSALLSEEEDAAIEANISND